MNEFYKTDRYHVIIYETLKIAKSVMLRRNRAPLFSDAAISYLQEETKMKVKYCERGEPILVLKKEKIGSQQEEYWHVIIGEKIGWIIVQDWHEMKLLERKK